MMTEPINQDERSLGWGEIGTPTDLWSASKALTFASQRRRARLGVRLWTPWRVCASWPSA